MGVYVTPPTSNHSKINSLLEQQSVYFLGFSPYQKGYKVYDLVNKTITVTRHVEFQEDVFPYRSECPTVESSIPLLVIATTQNGEDKYDPTPSDSILGENTLTNQNMDTVRESESIEVLQQNTGVSNEEMEDVRTTSTR